MTADLWSVRLVPAAQPLGIGALPSPAVLQSGRAAPRSRTMVTASLRRQGISAPPTPATSCWELPKSPAVPVLPNTAGCHSDAGGRDHGADGAPSQRRSSY